MNSKSIWRTAMRRALAPADLRVAVCGGNNKKTLDRTSLSGRADLGSWHLLNGGRVGAQARLYISPWGFDSPCLQPYYTRLSSGVLK